MNDLYQENIIYLCKCIHYTTNLPVFAIRNREMFFSLINDSIKTRTDLYGYYSDYNLLDINTKYQIIENEYKENFFVVSLLEINTYLIIGPFLNKKISEGTITNMIRDGIIPFHKKTIALGYYKQIPFFNEDRIFYTSKLIENVFDKAQTDFKIEEKEDIVIDKQKREYNSNVKQNRINSFLHSSYTNELRVIETIKNGDTENAKIILNEINLTPHAKLAIDAIRSYKNSMICSCTFMTRAAISGGVNPNAAFTLSDTYINKIENIQRLNELENFEAQMVEGFTDLVNNVKENKYSQSILDAMNYIDEHLCEDIKIKDIAKVAYLNPSYLSNLFHKETNTTISDWILRKRINEAAFSLANTNEEIADIAFFYHFCSQSYFVKCFKKIMGTTPNEYRKNQTSPK